MSHDFDSVRSSGAMTPKKDVLSFIDARREIRRPPLVGMEFLHEPAVRAATVAALVAARASEPLHLIYAMEPSSSFDVANSVEAPARAREKTEAERLRKLGAEVEERLVAGVPDEVIVDQVEASAARLVVLGSLGRRSGSKWRLGSTADRTAQTSPVPVLVVRGGEAFDIREFVDL